MNSFKRIQTNIVSNSYRINKRNSNLNTFPNSDSYSRNSYIYNSIKLFGTKAETVSTDSIPKFSFGVIADIQYADIDDAMNFQKTKVRRYRNSLKIFKDAAHYWKSIPQLSFNIILGNFSTSLSLFCNFMLYLLH